MTRLPLPIDADSWNAAIKAAADLVAGNYGWAGSLEPADLDHIPHKTYYDDLAEAVLELVVKEDEE